MTDDLRPGDIVTGDSGQEYVIGEPIASWNDPAVPCDYPDPGRVSQLDGRCRCMICARFGELVRVAEALRVPAASLLPSAGPAAPQGAPQGRPARVEVKGFRDLGIVRVSESALAGEPMLRAESADGAVAEFPASSLHFITWLPEGHPQPALTSGDPWSHGDEVYGSDDPDDFVQDRHADLDPNADEADDREPF